MTSLWGFSRTPGVSLITAGNQRRSGWSIRQVTRRRIRQRLARLDFGWRVHGALEPVRQGDVKALDPARLAGRCGCPATSPRAHMSGPAGRRVVSGALRRHIGTTLGGMVMATATSSTAGASRRPAGESRTTSSTSVTSGTGGYRLCTPVERMTPDEEVRMLAQQLIAMSQL